MTDIAAPDELALLRRRAYGPDADIEDDPAALARLRELEAAAGPEGRISRGSSGLQLPARADEPAAPAKEQPAEALAAPSEPPADSEGDTGMGQPVAPPPREPLSAWLPRRRGWWAGSLAIAAAAGVVLSLVTTPAVPRTGGGREVGVLAEDPGFERPDFFEVAPESLRGFEEFFGLTVFSSGEEWIGGGTDECLLVVGPASDERQPQFFLGCGVGAFAAAVQFRVQPGMPDELLERYPEGTPLQFIRQGDAVRVLAGDPS